MSKHLHFFKAQSRLGLINAPYGSHDANIGVEQGPDAVLTDSFLRQISANYSLSHFVFTQPEDLKDTDMYKKIADEYGNFVHQINEFMYNGKIQVVIGGDHSVAYASTLALLQRLEGHKTVGFVQFDSHADLHTVKTSPSGNFHGMWLRALTDRIDNIDIDSMTKTKLDPHSIIYIGNLETQAEEDLYIAKNAMQVWGKDDVINNFELAKQFLRSFITHFDHIHVSFDVDVFDVDFVTATGTPSADGLDPSHIFPLLEELSNASSLSLDIVEVNPKKVDYQDAVDLAQQVIETLLKV